MFLGIYNCTLQAVFVKCQHWYFNLIGDFLGKAGCEKVFPEPSFFCKHGQQIDMLVIDKVLYGFFDIIMRNDKKLYRPGTASFFPCFYIFV